MNRSLTRIYERHGPTGLLGLGIVILGIAQAGFVALISLIAARYANASWERIEPFLLGGEGLAIVCSAVGVLVSWRVLAPFLGWPRSDRTPERAVEAWTHGVTAPRRLIVRVVIANFAWIPPFSWFWVATLDQPGWAFPVELVANVLAAVAFASFAVIALEYLLRPALKDIAAYLPADFEPVTPVFSLRAKALIPIPGAIVLAVAVSTAYIDTTEAYALRLTMTIAIGLVAAGATVALFLLLAHAALDPIDELTAATRRVKDGDVTTPIPLVSADELGTLAASFNTMLAGLREREGLRADNLELNTALRASLDDVRASRARIVTTADEERRRMERDLHDGAQQRLVLVALKAEMLSAYVSTEGAALLAELQADARQAVDELRDLAHGIYPPLLESDGLSAALEDVADDAAVPVTVEIDGTGRYPAPVEAAVYFCCLEALQNAAKHAGDGAHVRIALSEHGGRLQFTVSDDGSGFDLAAVNGRAGLQNMTDRIGALGGTVRIDSAPDRGTRVEGTVPL